MKTRISVGLISILLTMSSHCLAAPRSFPGLDIISRDEWGATESWRYFSTQGYKSRLERTNAYTSWLAGSGEDTTGEFATRKAREEITTARESFLSRYYPEEMVIDNTIREVDGKKLLRGLSYHRAKAKIIIHHTVTRQVHTYEDAKKSLQEIYKQHTISQSRGDIGYNFLIDPMGTVYEGRAGGKDVIAAHADRNNARTIGVSLLGNYDTHTPSARMWLSLKKVLLGIMLEYGINPYQKQAYFTPINKDPWLEVHHHESIVGHSDTKNTACPGAHVEDKLPKLRKEMSELYTTLQSRKKASLGQFRFLTKKFSVWMKEDRVVAKYPLPNRVIRDCKLFGDDVSLKQCGGDGRHLIVTLTRETTSPSGQYILLVDTDAGAVWIDLVVVRESQVDELLTSRQKAYPLTTLPKTTSQKIEKKILLTDLPAIQQRQIGVLLYEPTTELPHREMQCESGCAIVLDDQRFSDIRTIRVQPGSGQQLTVFLDLKKYTTSRIRLYNPRSVVTFMNRQRGSDQFPLNYFRGDISIQYEKYTTVDKKERIGRTVVNRVFMDDYLRGLAETVEEQHPEKLRTMALLVKGYISFYGGGNRHPSVPAGVSYQAIDDPRLFQKYIGAGGEQTMPHWHQALEKTASEYVVYDTYLPLLPFFHCSAGFIRSGKETFGWTDTPWLVSKLDVASCETPGFAGHGVGLSGEGAERLAQAGATYQQIVRYYYPGVKIVSLNTH